MAKHLISQPNILRRWFGISNLGAIVFALLILIPITALIFWAADQNAAARINYSIYRIFRFTLWQAALSTLGSVLLGLIIAWAVSHSSARVARLARVALLAPLVMPVITICLSWNFLLGKQGLAGLLGITRPYGFGAILSVHIFLNMTLIAWMVLPAWEKAPHGYWRNARILGLQGWQLWRQLEWPLLRPYLFRASALCFLFCFTSFTPVFLLGGGPKFTTFETAIYAALKTNFDPVYALILGAIQFVICSMIIVGILRNLPNTAMQIGDERRDIRLGAHRSHHFANALVIITSLICLSPLLSLLHQATNAIFTWLSGDLSRTSTKSMAYLPSAIGMTLVVILGGMVCSLLLGWAIVMQKSRLQYLQKPHLAQWLEVVSGSVYALPSLMMGAGWLALLSLSGLWGSQLMSYFAFVGITVLIGVPVVVRAVLPAYEQVEAQYHKLCRQLKLSGWYKVRWIIWPRLRATLMLSAAYAGIMGAGDLGAFILVSQDTPFTLPILIQRQMASYDHRIATVSALALILVQAFWLYLIYRLTRRERWQERAPEAATKTTHWSER